MNVYVMRHGLTNWNEQGITQGRSRTRLSEIGEVITKQTSESFKDIKIQIIFASPIMRVMQTARIMNKFHGVNIVKDERLTEQDKGIFTGRVKSTMTPEELELKRKCDPSTKVESFESVAKRAEEFACEIMNLKGYNTILIVTHGIVACYLDDMFTSGSVQIESYKDKTKPRFKNAEIRYYKI